MIAISFGAFTSIRSTIRNFSKSIRGFEDKDVIQLTFQRIDSLLKIIDRNDDQKAFLFLKELMPSWNNSDCLLLLAYCIEKARPLLVGRRSLIQQEEALAMAKANAPIKEQKFSLLVEKITALYTERRSIETRLAGSEISDLDFGNNNYQEQAIFVDAQIKELKEQILAL